MLRRSSHLSSGFNFRQNAVIRGALIRSKRHRPVLVHLRKIILQSKWFIIASLRILICHNHLTNNNVILCYHFVINHNCIVHKPLIYNHLHTVVTEIVHTEHFDVKDYIHNSSVKVFTNLIDVQRLTMTVFKYSCTQIGEQT